MADNTTTLVLGGTGKTGRRVIEQLTARDIRTRSASRTGETPFDWLDRSTWEPALADVRAVYLVYLQDLGHPDAAPHIRDFLRLAASRGVERVVMLSARGWDAAHPAEQAVRDAGIDWTILRPTWFAQNFSEDMFLPSILGGELRLPTADGHEPFIDAEDVAAVAVAALTEDGHSGQVYELSGPRLLTFGDAVALIAKATGRDVRYTPISSEEFIADLLQAGLTAEEAPVVDGLLGIIARGGNAYLSDGVQRALGREPRDFAGFAERTADTGAWHA
ncbi:NAD(P)H-binding protein [Streptomyces sp. P1-3]|uniref:NAD(P)H-binding protein n=1 Tax=Streptomyces sp. P1-3 TaxID=3421658 RepID=UPI003D363DE2